MCVQLVDMFLAYIYVYCITWCELNEDNSYLKVSNVVHDFVSQGNIVELVLAGDVLPTQVLASHKTRCTFLS